MSLDEDKARTEKSGTSSLGDIPLLYLGRPGLFEKSGSKLGNHILCH